MTGGGAGSGVAHPSTSAAFARGVLASNGSAIATGVSKTGSQLMLGLYNNDVIVMVRAHAPPVQTQKNATTAVSGGIDATEVHGKMCTVCCPLAKTHCREEHPDLSRWPPRSGHQDSSGCDYGHESCQQRSVLQRPKAVCAIRRQH